VSFAIITVLAQTVGARDHPEGIAEVFGLALACAVALGLVYGQGRGKRAWCRHMCPIGLMLGVFSRLGAVQFAPKRPRAGGDAYIDKGVCPTMIAIDRKSESRHCIECLRCVNPNARGGLKIVFRRPGAEVADIHRHNPNAAEVWFLFVATGLSLGGFLWLVLPQYQWLRQAVGAWAIGHGWYWIGNPGPGWLMSVHPAAREVFTWLDFFMIVGVMLGCALALTAGLAALTALASALSCRFHAKGPQAGATRRRRFIELAYAYMPVAMMSLVIGLGGKLFDMLIVLGLQGGAVTGLKVALFAASALWSAALNHRLLGAQGLAGPRRWAAALPGLLGVSLVALAWWPAIFGV